MVIFTEDYKRRVSNRMLQSGYRIAAVPRIVVRQMDNALAQAFSPGDATRWYSDEQGPNAYSYFLSAIGFDVCSAISERCAFLGLDVTRLQVTVGADTSSSGENRLSGIRLNVLLDGGAGSEQLLSAIRESMPFSALLNTLAKCTAITKEFKINGADVSSDAG
ncbi:MAG: OsmC family protein [Thermoprotei archaeon]